MTTGGRNLIIMGALSIIIAITTTSISLIIYHNSGDIYLDRSRPNALPDKEEIENEKDKNDVDYKLSENETITSEVLDEYLENLQQEIDNINTYKGAFSENGLSDSRLGI